MLTKPPKPLSVIHLIQIKTNTDSELKFLI